MRVGRFVRHVGISVMGIAVLSLWQSNGMQASAQHHPSAGDKGQANALVRIVREATERFQDVAVAEAEGYSLAFGCVSGPDYGAMGLHYVNGPLVFDG